MFKGIKNNRLDIIEEPDYILEKSDSLFSPIGNALPMIFNVQAPRSLYGAKFFEQTLPLAEREAPLVRNLNLDTGRSWDFELGESMGAIRAPDNGVVDKVDEDSITIKTEGGEIKTIDLYNKYPFNRYTMISNKPLIKEGDKFQAGQTLASSNFTDDEGRMAIGVNARIAVTPFKGHSMDDAIVISESFAKRLTSEHANTIDLEKDVDAKVGKGHYISLFPKKFTRDQLEKVGEDGVVLPGTILNPGDPVQLSTRPKTFRSDSADIGKLSRSARFTRKDSAQIWEGHHPAEVIDVVTSRKGDHRILVSYKAPAEPGDKLSLRNGQKATISKILSDDQVPRSEDGRPVEVIMNQLGLPCFDELTEMLTTRGWLPVSEVSLSDKVATLNQDTFRVEFQSPDKVIHAPYTGKMYSYCSDRLDMCVTPHHRQFSASSKSDGKFELLEAEKIFGEPRQYLKAADWFGKDPGTVVARGLGESHIFMSVHWAQFVGWFLSRGCVCETPSDGPKGSEKGVLFSCSGEEYADTRDRIYSLMSAMGLHYIEGPGDIFVGDACLAACIKIFGGEKDRYIPREVLDMPPSLLRVFLDALTEGEEGPFVTPSRRLADDVQEAATKIGIASDVTREELNGGEVLYRVEMIEESPSAWANDPSSDQGAERWVDYDGLVHCVTVPNDIVFVRRNGKAVFSGNSRVNASSYFELMLGKVAEKTGKAITLPAHLPGGQSMEEFVTKNLEKAGVDPYEVIIDPQTNKPLGQKIAVGNGHVLKLHHQAGKKLRHRGQGGYDINRMPLKGGGDGGGAQRLSGLEMSVLESSGARGVKKESILLRGEMRSDYWRAMRENRALPKLDRPFVWDKFLALLNGSGVNTKDLGKGRLRLTPLTDRDLDEKEAVEIQNGKIVNMRTWEPEAGGLFDPLLSRQQRWGKITLPVPMVNPAYENQVRNLLGLTQKELDSLLEEPSEKRASIEDLRQRLRDLDLDKMREEALAEIRSGKKTRRQKAVKKLRAIEGLKRAGVSPEDLIISKVPVIPPGFRPYTVSGDTFLPGDANELYSDLIKSKQIYEESVSELGKEGSSEMADYLRKSVRAVYGYEDSPNPKIRGRGVSGFFKKVVGGNPKTSFVQNKLISKPQDHVGRGVISPDPSLGMDELAIPADMAWDIFRDPLERRLASQGIPRLRRLQLIKDRHPIADQNLREEMRTRPVVYSRAPAWHKQNVISGYAKMSEGDNIMISPLVTAGLAGDFDGDAQFGYVFLARKKKSS